jgi:hypothetical protein
MKTKVIIDWIYCEECPRFKRNRKTVINKNKNKIKA